MYGYSCILIILSRDSLILNFPCKKLSILISLKRLTHAKILGTVLNQLGIDRKLFGDILVNEERAQIIINRQFMLLFQDGITKVARLPVRLEERDFTEKIATVEDYQELDICIASSRLDVFLAGVFKLSRNQASQLIENR